MAGDQSRVFVRPNLPILLCRAYQAFNPREQPPADAVQAACGIRPQLPAWLDGLMTRPERVRIVRNDQAEVETFVLSASRAAKQGVS